jgi:hypothetical protein
MLWYVIISCELHLYGPSTYQNDANSRPNDKIDNNECNDNCNRREREPV